MTSQIHHESLEKELKKPITVNSFCHGTRTNMELKKFDLLTNTKKKELFKSKKIDLTVSTSEESFKSSYKASTIINLVTLEATNPITLYLFPVCNSASAYIGYFCSFFSFLPLTYYCFSKAMVHSFRDKC